MKDYRVVFKGFSIIKLKILNNILNYRVREGIFIKKMKKLIIMITL